jgi:predicted ribosome quality control (RQC) complex YloA/Tae2 family protein
MLSLRELRRAADILDRSLAGAKIQRVLQLDEYRLVCSLYGVGSTTILLFSCRPGFARVSQLAGMPRAPASPPPFVQYFRAHLSRSVLEEVWAGEDDRRLSVRLRSKEGCFQVILSILGSRSNVYLLDSNDRLLQALRSLEATRPELVLGEEWTAPRGTVRSEGSDRWEDRSADAYLASVEAAYSRLERAKEIEDLSRKIEQALAREASFLARKASNLAEDLGRAAHYQEQRRRGELLKGALHLIVPGAEEVSTRDYETGEQVVIGLDPKLSPAENLSAYFHRYQRKQRAASAIQNQLNLLGATQAEIESLQEEMKALLRKDDPDLAALEERMIPISPPSKIWPCALGCESCWHAIRQPGKPEGPVPRQRPPGEVFRVGFCPGATKPNRASKSGLDGTTKAMTPLPLDWPAAMISSFTWRAIRVATWSCAVTGGKIFLQSHFWTPASWRCISRSFAAEIG